MTSFRPKSSHLRDDTILNTVRPISDLSTLYYEFSEYRLEMLADRFQTQLKKLRSDNRAGKKTALKQLKDFMASQIKFLEHMDREMLNYEDVVEGILPVHDMPEDAPADAPQFEDGSKRRRLS